MIELVHEVDWPECREGAGDDNLLRVVCVCGWRSVVRHEDNSGFWWRTWANHLHGVIKAEQFVRQEAAR